MTTTGSTLVAALDRRFHACFADRSETPFAIRTFDGVSRSFGSGAPAFTLLVHTRNAASALQRLDALASVRAYLGGELDVEGDFESAVEFRRMFAGRGILRQAWQLARPVLQGQVRADRAAISFHYDEDPDFYLLFLDPRHRCYTQGIFATDDEPLEDAITRKLDFALEAIGAREGDRVLDIGGGWGAFVEHAGRRGIRVTSLTLSGESERYLRGLVDRERLPCEIVLRHLYEHAPAHRYDAIVNMGVSEHLPDYRATLRSYMALLKPGGRIYLDCSATRRKHALHDFTRKFIFPGNGSPVCLHAYLGEVARTPLRLLAVHDDRHNYYLTARAWAENLDRAREVVEARWDRSLHRRFQIFLWGLAATFRAGSGQAYRLVLAAPP
jgi:cyclopropane-fatty-acyl-phospholipid synthase